MHKITLKIPSIIVIILAASIVFSFSRETVKMRDKAFTRYSVGDYDEALPMLRTLVARDTSAFFWMDYFMLADIFLRKGLKDSAKWVVVLGRERTQNSMDNRIVKRNNLIWEDLEKQLKFQRNSFKLPQYKSLEEFAEPPPDSTLSDSTQTASEDTAVVIAEADSSAQSIDSTLINSPEISSQGDTALFNPGSIVTQPKIIGGMQILQSYIEKQALFPQKAIEAEVKQGVVLVNVTVDTSGNAVDFMIMRAEPEGLGFEEAAVEALRNMRFEPASSDGQKITGSLQQTVPFNAP